VTELALIAKATVILGVALVATRIACNARASVRSLILAAAFALVLILPVASAVVPPRQLSIPDNYAPVFLLEDVNPPATMASAPVRLPDASRQDRHFPSAASLTRATWLLGVLATLAPLWIGLWRVRSLRNRSRAWAEGRELADALRASLGVRRVVAVVVHDDPSVPMTCGWLRPAIVMPADAPNWPAAEIRQALVHELEHVRRRDWPVHVVARITCALYWFHPAAWIAWRQLRLESERACDDAVVTHADDVAYAEQLVALARRFGTAAAPLLSMADRRTLATRVAAILNRNVARGRVGAGFAAAIVFAAAALSAVISPLQARGASQAAGTPPPLASSPDAFDVASIRRNTSGGQGQTIELQGSTFVGRNVTARELVMTAFRVRSEDVSGGPGWIDAERYDVSGRAQTQATWDAHLLMLQRLLVDRFKLSIRREKRTSPAYALIVGRSGSTLTPAADPNCAAPIPGAKCGGFATRPGFFDGRRVTVAQVAALLSSRSGRPVLDRTGISGYFDVKLSWTPDSSQLPRGLPPDAVPPFDPAGPSLFAAIQEQLGLRLEPTTADMDHVVIEQIERPTPNDAPEPVAGVAQSADRQAFDLATVRLNTSRSEFSRGPMLQPGNRLIAQNVMVRSLIMTAFGLRYEQIVNGPAWLNTTHVDVEARARDGASADDVRAMLQTLLHERFALRAHHESREQPVYALLPSGTRRGPGLRPAAETCTPVVPPARRPSTTPVVTGGGMETEPLITIGSQAKCPRMFFPGFVGARHITMVDFAASLTPFARRTVVDRTGMAGDYDVDLVFTPDVDGVATGDSVPLFTAVEEQLGLKLEATRAPVQVLAIDAVERPTPN
jgi:uncharacterized protein (TIGR03435 family)